MHLTNEEVKRFYNIWIPLLHYINQKQQLVPFFPAQWSNAPIDPELAFPLREALWEDDSLRDAFIAENPANLSADDLALVASWKYRVEGSFFIFRHLKKYSIFLQEGAPSRAYGVEGITDSIKAMAGPYLPIYVQAVLIPFEDRIIYDSLILPYSIYFGGGIRSSLNEKYRDIKEREGIVTSLLPDVVNINPENIKKEVMAKNKKLLSAFQKALGQSGLSVKMIQEHTQVITDFSQSYLLQQTPPRLLIDVSLADIQAYLKTAARKINPVSFKRFIWFMRDTWRMDFDQAEEVLNFLKKRG